MSDSGKYINTYIDSAITMSHDFMVQILQLKTELKLINDLVQEKDQVISVLTKEKEDAVQNLIKEKEDAVTNLTQERDRISTSLQQENEKHRNEIQSESEKLRLAQEEVNKALSNARHWEDQFNAMKNKVSHIDAIGGQLNSMKQELIKKTEEVEKLKKKLEDKDSPKKNINTKGKNKPVEPTIEETDDF